MSVGNTKRPLLRYYGGKWRIAPWIMSYFPVHKVYTECYGGAASLLLQKPQSFSEIYNDIDDEIVNPFTVMRDYGSVLIEKLKLTPYSRTEFIQSYLPSDDPIEQARRTIIRSFQGFGPTSAVGKKTGFRSNSNKSNKTPSNDFKSLPWGLEYIIYRLRGVVIENKDAISVMKQHDSKKTLQYVDPPYVHDTRIDASKQNSYMFELTDSDHQDLSREIKDLKGMVVLSGYRSDLYDEQYKDWHRIDCHAYADGAKSRIESLWLNESALLNQVQISLF